MQTALPLTGWAGGGEMPAQFSFVDLFAGIGGMRLGFEAIGGQCVFTCEWNKHSQQTYRANFGDEEFQDAQNIYRMSIPEMVKRGWTLFNDEKIPGRLGIRSVIPDWNELTWAQQTYYRAKYRFDENGVLEIGVSEINSASPKTISHFHCDWFTEENYVTPDGAMSGSNDRIREILEQNRVDLAYRSYDDTALVHTGPDGSIIYTNEVGWGPPMYWPEEKYYYELDDHRTCFWETGPYWVSEMPCWACPECNGF